MASLASLRTDHFSELFKFLDIRDLLCVRSASQWLSQRLAPRAAPGAWAAARPPDMLDLLDSISAAGARLLDSVYGFATAAGCGCTMLDALRGALCDCQIDKLEWLESTFGISESLPNSESAELLLAAHAGEHDESARWVERTFAPITNSVYDVLTAFCQQPRTVAEIQRVVDEYQRAGLPEHARLDRNSNRAIDTFAAICTNCDLSVAQWFAALHDCAARHALVGLGAACARGDFRIAAWLIRAFDLIPTMTWRTIASIVYKAGANGHCDVADWLMACIPSTAIVHDAVAVGDALKTACARGRLDAVRWLVQLPVADEARWPQRVLADAFDTACNVGYVPVVQWIMAESAVPHDLILTNISRAAARSRNARLVEMLLQFVGQAGSEICEAFALACMRNDLDTAVLFERLVVPHPSVLQYGLYQAHGSGSRTIIDWLTQKHGCSFEGEHTDDPCYRAVADRVRGRDWTPHGSIAMMQWAIAHSHPVNILNQIFEAACREDDVALLQWVMARCAAEGQICDVATGTQIACECCSINVARLLVSNPANDEDWLLEVLRDTICQVENVTIAEVIIEVLFKQSAPSSHQVIKLTDSSLPFDFLNGVGMCSAVARWLVTRFSFADVAARHDGRLLSLACCAGSVADARWFAAQFGCDTTDMRAGNHRALRRACAAGRRDIVRWLVEEFGRDSVPAEVLVKALETALRHAYRMGKTRAARWLIERFDLRGRALGACLLRDLCESPKFQPRGARWLIERFSLTVCDVANSCINLDQGHGDENDWRELVVATLRPYTVDPGSDAEVDLGRVAPDDDTAISDTDDDAAALYENAADS